jgi:TLD
MGGQLGYFAWFIDASLQKGQSENACSTFGLPNCLSSSNSFTLCELEVWSIGNCHSSGDSHIKNNMSKQSVLIKHQDMFALLDLARPPTLLPQTDALAFVQEAEKETTLSHFCNS